MNKAVYCYSDIESQLATALRRVRYNVPDAVKQLIAAPPVNHVKQQSDVPAHGIAKPQQRQNHFHRREFTLLARVAIRNQLTQIRNIYTSRYRRYRLNGATGMPSLSPSPLFLSHTPLSLTYTRPGQGTTRFVAAVTRVET